MEAENHLKEISIPPLHPFVVVRYYTNVAGKYFLLFEPNVNLLIVIIADARMTACRFYEAGYCRYGYRCRNDHTSGRVQFLKYPFSFLMQDVKEPVFIRHSIKIIFLFDFEY
jgi:hypothetical protein